MNHYELLAIISGKYAEPEAVDILHTIEETIKKHASTFHYSQNLERKKLAYPVSHHSYGTYILIEFDCPATVLKAIDHEIRHMNELIRYTIVRREKVGAPKEFERKEQRTFVPASTTPAPASGYIPPVSSTPVMQAPLEPSLPVSVSAIAEEPLEIKEPEKAQEKSWTHVPILDLDAAIVVPEDESRTESEDNKKKQKKVTYEELDKKLDEILNSTIL